MSDQRLVAPEDMPVNQPGPYGHITDGLGSAVTRQAGLPPASSPTIDPTPLPKIIQPGDGTVVSRNPSKSQFFGGDGVLYSDRPQDGTVHVDGVFADVMGGEPNLPPGIARTAMPLPPPSGFGDMPAAQQREAVKAATEAMGFIVSDAPGGTVPPVAGVMQADAGAVDPRDKSTQPQIISALPVIKKAPIVPVVTTASNALPEPRSRRVIAKAAPTAKAAKKAGR